MRRALITLVVLALPAHGIVMRHDREPERYRALAAKYPAVCTVGGQVACTLVAPRWVLTAGHTVEEYFNPGGTPFVTFGTTRYDVDKMIVHPKRVLRAVDSDYDLALLHLTRPVEGITPVLLYEGTDEPEKIVTIAGPGAVGTGQNTNKRERPGAIYAARNKIEGAFEHSLIMTFSAPPDGEDLEGVAGAGDSGCPALFERDGKLFVLGVGSWNSGSEGTESTYNTIDAFARVSSHRQWISETIASDPPSTIRLFGPFKAATSADELPAGKVATAAAALLSAFNSGKLEEIAAFYHDFGRPRTDEEMKRAVSAWQALMDQYGRYELVGYRPGDAGSIVLIVRATKTALLRGVMVTLNEAGKVGRMAMGDIDSLPR